MKKICTVCCLVILLAACGGSPQTLELPIEYRNDYGPFIYHGGSGIGFRDHQRLFNGNYPRINGIPEEWTDVQFAFLPMDNLQIRFQNYHQGFIPLEELEKQMEAYPDRDMTALSRSPLKCFVTLVSAIDADGVRRIFPDSDNNYDMRGERPVEPAPRGRTSAKSGVEEIYSYTIPVAFERYTQRGIIQDTVRVLFYGSGDNISVNYARHGVVQYGGNEYGLVSMSFAKMDYNDPGIIRLPMGDEGISTFDLVKRNEYIDIDGQYYIFKGVDVHRDMVLLDKAPKGELFSTQAGFRAPLFTAGDFSNGRTVSLEGLRGRYVFLDFWSPGCAPCLCDMPALKELYDNTDRDVLQFVGIIPDFDKPSGIRETIDKFGITWPQIHSGPGCDVNKMYNVTSYPTTLLLDPEGVIIDKNIYTADQLKARLKELGLLE